MKRIAFSRDSSKVANLVTPDSLLAWYRTLIALKWTYARKGPGRPFVSREITELGTTRKYWGHLTELDRYIRSNRAMIPNYHRRYHAGQRVSTALVESAVNSLVNHRMNKRGQKRWSAEGAAHLLSVRTAVVNGVLPTTRRHVETPTQSNISTLRLAA